MALPTVTVQRIDGRLEVKDNPGLYWEFYFSFIIGGLVALYVAFTSDLSRTSLLLAIVISAGAIGGGVVLLAREPASVVVFDRPNATLQITRWTLFKRVHSSRPLSDVASATVERKNDLETGGLVRPGLALLDGSTLPISTFWYKKAEASQAAVEQVNSFLS